MPSYDDYGAGWDPTSANVTRDYDRYVGNGGFAPSPVAAQNVPGARVDNWGGWTPPDYLTQPGMPPTAMPGGSHDDPDLMTRIWRYLTATRGTRNAAAPQNGPGASRQAGYGDAAAPSPFEPPPAAAPPAKPASQLASSKAITDRINKMLLPAEEPPPVHWEELAPERGARDAPFSYPAYTPQPRTYPNSVHSQAHNAPFDLFQTGPTPDRAPVIDMRRKDVPTAEAPSPFGVPAFASSLARAYGQGYGRADGGQIPGFMRGGYPDLYGVDEPPGIPERTFDSGGQSYVDNGGGSTGRADDVNAKLSEKEYVVDAETMALLGDGNPDAGAKKMDKFREDVRKHKGKQLAKGKISPDAKPAVSSYIAGNPMGDGLRRRGKERG